MFGYHKKMEQILESLDAEQAADTRMLDTETRIIAERPPAEVAGVDLSAVRQVHPGFDDQGFLGIVGAMVSGVAMANTHVLARSADTSANS